MAMHRHPLHHARPDRIRLRVRNLHRMASFYRDVLRLEAVDSADAGTVLTPPGQPEPGFELVLSEDPEARPAPAPSVGLYHFALLYPDRSALALAVETVLDMGWERIDGASDHGVSEAFYIRDPEGNGVELCRDRPRDAWTERNGEVVMGTDPLDLDELLAAAGSSAGSPSRPTLGHVHLHVADLDASRNFYVNVLGLRVRQSTYPGALFLAAGDYHHHLGLNVWARGRTPPSPAAGLMDYGWRMSPDRMAAVARNAREAGLDVSGPEGGGSRGANEALVLHDPDGVGVVLRPRSVT